MFETHRYIDLQKRSRDHWFPLLQSSTFWRRYAGYSNREKIIDINKMFWNKKVHIFGLSFPVSPTHILYWSRTTLQQRRCNKGLFIHVCLLIIQFCFSNSCLQHVTCTLNAADEIGWWWKKIWISVIAVLYLPFFGGGDVGVGGGLGMYICPSLSIQRS